MKQKIHKKITEWAVLGLIVLILVSACQWPLIKDSATSSKADSEPNDDVKTTATAAENAPTQIVPPSNEDSSSLEDKAVAEEEKAQEENGLEADKTAEETQENQSPSTTEPSNQESGTEEAPQTTPESPVVLGPENFPEGINPLTGQAVENPDLLMLPPALLSISNFPASARPQAGLNTSPFTFEMTIGEGMTRFLSLFYGDFPKAASGQTEGQAPEAAIGPIRSGRLPYEDLRGLYNGFLVMASAYSGVAQTLSSATSIYGSDSDDINSALIDMDTLSKIAQAQSERVNEQAPYLEGLTFSETPPEGGMAADRLWIFYSSLNQIQWRYDSQTGAYIRHDITTDGSGQFPESTDRLTGEPISKENVIVLFALHDFKAPTLIDIQLTNMPPMKALLFRDGQMYEIFWTTQFGEFEQETGLMRPIRFVDAEGNPFPLKPGQTWVQIVTNYSYYLESENNEQPFYGISEEAGSGLWLVRYKGKY